jgi:hypothetical protein
MLDGAGKQLRLAGVVDLARGVHVFFLDEKARHQAVTPGRRRRFRVVVLLGVRSLPFLRSSKKKADAGSSPA